MPRVYKIRIGQSVRMPTKPELGVGTVVRDVRPFPQYLVRFEGGRSVWAWESELVREPQEN